MILYPLGLNQWMEPLEDTDSSPQYSDSADTTEDTTQDNSGAVENSATSEREQSGPAQESVVDT